MSDQAEGGARRLGPRLAPELCDREISDELEADIAAGYGQQRMSPDEFFAALDRDREQASAEMDAEIAAGGLA